jgi:hypothetical protein
LSIAFQVSQRYLFYGVGIASIFPTRSVVHVLQRFSVS